MSSVSSQSTNSSPQHRRGRILLLTFIGTIAAMGAVAVAALRTAPTAGGVACGNSYSLTATMASPVHWTAAPWSVSSSTGPIDSYPGQTQSNDCATIYTNTVEVTGTNLTIAALNVTATMGNSAEVRIGSAGSLDATGNGSLFGGGNLARVRIDSGGTFHVPAGIQSVNSQGQIVVNGGTLAVGGPGEVIVNGGGKLIAGSPGVAVAGSTIAVMNINGIRIAANGAADIHAANIVGGGELLVGDTTTAGFSPFFVGYPGPVTIDGTSVRVVQGGTFFVGNTPGGPATLENGAVINVESGGALAFNEAYGNTNLALQPGANSGNVLIGPGGFLESMVAASTFIDVPVTNFGTIDIGGSSSTTALHLRGGGLLDGLIRTNFLAGHTLSLAGGHTVQNPTITGPGAVYNDGVLSINTGSLTINQSPVFNNGTINWSGPATIALESGAVLENTPTGFIMVTGDGSMLTGSTATFNNSGVFQKDGATGTTVIGTPAQPIPVQNNGTIDVFRGIVSIGGAYNQTFAGSLGFSLSGTTPGTGYGQLNTGPSPILDGVLNIALNAFTPVPGDTFQVMGFTGPPSGDFAAKNYPTFSDRMFTDSYNGSGLLLGVVSTESDLSITKSASSGVVATNGTFSYSIDVTNSGPDGAPNVVVTDTLPAGVTLMSINAPGWSCSGTSTISCSMASLAVGVAPTIVLNVTAPATAGTVSNTAAVSSDYFDSQTADNASTATITVAEPTTSYVVTNLNDSGPGSLREGLELAEAGVCAPCAITFNVPSPGPIPVGTPLPYPSVQVSIDARTQPGYAGTPLIGIDGALCGGCDGLALSTPGGLIAGLAIYNFFDGGAVWLEGGGAHSLEDNWIGVDLTGAAGLNLGGVIIDGASDNIITGNVISGNDLGILIFGSLTSDNNQITGNFIGTGPGGAGSIPNNYGIAIDVPSSNTTVTGNTIANNTVGVGVADGVGHVITSNSMYANSAGIDLGIDGPTANDVNDPDSGPNNFQNTPVISSVALSGGVLSAVVSVDSALANAQGIKLQLFEADAMGQGQTLLGEECVASNAITNHTMSVPAAGVVAGDLIVGTATGWLSTDCSSARGDGTSEFGAAVAVSCTPSPVTITGPSTMCASTSATATATAVAGATYSWTITNGTIQSGQGTSSVTFMAGSSGSVNLSVSVTNGCGATTTASHTVSIGAASATITPSGPTTFCQGGNVTLTANPGTSYLWSNGATTQSITVDSSGNYTVTVSQPGGCVATSAPTTVTVLAAPVASIVGPTSYCAAQPPVTLSVDGTGISSVMWSTGATTASISVSPSTTTTYTATVTGSNGCTKVLTHTLNVGNAGPPLDVIAPASVPAFSTGNTAAVNQPPAGVYTWVVINGTLTSGQGTPNITFTAGESGSVQLLVTVEAPSGCSSTGGVYVAITSCVMTPPALISPAADESVSSPVTFSWTAVPGATGYDVWRVEDGGTPAFVGSTIAPVTSLNASVPAGTFGWYVEARLPETCDPARTMSEVRRVTVTPGSNCPAAAPVIIGPIGISLFSPITFQWTGVENAIGYRVVASLDGLPATEIGTTGPDVTQLVATVPVGAVEWWVEAQYGGCPAVASTRATFQVDLEECFRHEEPLLVAPPTGAVSASSEVTFSWTAVAGADGYAVWLQQGTDRRAVGTTLGELSLTAVIDPGVYDWYVEAKFEGCPSTESEPRRIEVPASSNCPPVAPTLLSPSPDETVMSPRVTFAWSPVPNAIAYELWLSLASGAESLIGTTAATSMTAEVPEGESEWFIRARVDRCPNRDSSRRIIRYQPPAGCNTAAPLILLPLDDGRPITSPATFRWTAVPGATHYNLYVGRGNSEPELRSTTMQPQATNIAVPNGESRWFVEAVFSGCPVTRSSTGRFVAVPRPQSCVRLAAPVISVPGQVSADTSFTVQWTSVPGAESYLLTEFIGSESRTLAINGQSASFVYPNNTGEPITYVYRVRGVDADCSPAAPGLLSDALGVSILPARTTESSAVIGSLPIIQQVIPIGAEFAGQSFVATSAQPWVTIDPSSGIVPPGGIDLIVTVNTTDLPLGTSVAGVTITFGAGGAGRASVNGSTSTSTTVSVNLVTPVTATPKSSPPPDALIIPAVAHAEGVNALFRSDVRVSNTSPQVMKYQVTFVPTGGSGMTEGRQTTLDIQPGRTVALDDVLRTWFGTGTANVLGTLEVRPLTQTSASTSSAAVRGLPNFVTFASSRTFNQTPNGTFGTYIPAIPFANFIGGATAGSPASPTLSLQQISQSLLYRSNFGVVEGSGNPAQLLVSVFNGAGSKIDEFPVALNGGEHLQMSGFLHQRGIELEDGRVEVKVASGSGKVTAYAAVVNNATGDSLVVTPTTLGGEGSTKYVLPGVAELTGGVVWQTDVRLFNAGDQPVMAKLTLHSLNNNPPQQTEIQLAPGEIRQLDRVLTTLFGVSNDGGALHVETEEASNLVATARTYRPAGDGGNFGQFIQAVTPQEAARLGSRPLQILQVEQSSRFRSNVGLAEVTGNPATVELTIIPPDSKVSARLLVDMGPNQFRQLNSLLEAIGLRGTHNARVTVRVVGGQGRVAAYAATIDEITQDPTFIPAQ